MSEGQMDSDTLIAALRQDLAATSRERDGKQAQRNAALAEVAKLEADAKAASTPDAQICAGLHALRRKFESLF